MMTEVSSSSEARQSSSAQLKAEHLVSSLTAELLTIEPQWEDAAFMGVQETLGGTAGVRGQRLFHTGSRGPSILAFFHRTGYHTLGTSHGLQVEYQYRKYHSSWDTSLVFGWDLNVFIVKWLCKEPAYEAECNWHLEQRR